MHNVKIKANPAASCEYHRVFLPFEHIEVESKNPVFYFNRLPGIHLDISKSLRSLGFKIICDVDDYWILEEDHYLFEQYKQLGILERSIAAIKKADIVTTTTAELASKIQEHNKNVVVIPNALPFDQGQFKRSEDKDSDTPFIYVGGGSHRRDLSLINNHKDKLTIAGYAASDEWDKIVASFPQSQIEPAKHSFSYMDFYDGHRIAIAPLLKNTFNSCKSNLKVLEAGCKGLPIIASKCLPYFNGLDKEAVLFAANKSEFSYLMDRLLRNPNLAEDMGQKLAEHVREHYHLDKANLIRKQIIESF